MISLDRKLYDHRLFFLLVYANGCESKLIPLQIKLLESIKKRGRITRNEVIAYIKRIYVGGQKAKVSKEGWSSRVYNIISPLTQSGILTSTKGAGNPVYTLSDGWLMLIRQDFIRKPKEWFKETDGGHSGGTLQKK